MIKKLFLFVTVLILIIVSIYLFRIPLFNAVGDYLVKEDSLQKADAIFVLSGDPYDRGRKAKELFLEGWAPVIVATGENISHNLKALGVPYTESDLTRYYLTNNGVDSTHIVVIAEGSSTIEEAEVILNYTNKHSFKKVIVVSSKFHTRRIHTFFKKKFDEANIDLIVQGAPSTLYREEEWWKKEDGLIMVNNEYVKLLYYGIKY